MSTETLLFVYGSLRKQGSHNHLLGEATWISEGFTKGKLFLIDWYPGMILSLQESKQDDNPEIQQDWVYGDIYKISSYMFLSLDSYEGDAYDRIFVLVRDRNNNIHQAQTYVYNQNIDDKKNIQPADWIEYIKTHEIPKPDQFG